MRSLHLLPCSVLLLLSSPAMARIVEVEVGGPVLAFRPALVQVEPGTIVRWINRGGGHTVTADDGLFSSGAPDGGAWVFEHTFNNQGTYRYHSETFRNLGMSGTVEVRFASLPPSPVKLENNLACNGMRTISCGEEVAGVLDDLSCLWRDANGVVFERSASFLLPPVPLGWGVEVTMRSRDMDSFLDVQTFFVSVSWSDDDAGGGRDARVFFVSKLKRAMLIRARTFGSETGSYSLVVNCTPPAPPAPEEIEVTGQITAVRRTGEDRGEADLVSNGTTWTALCLRERKNLGVCLGRKVGESFTFRGVRQGQVVILPAR